MKITLTDRLGNEKAKVSGETQVKFNFQEEYGFEDILIFETEPESFVEIDIDPHFVNSIVYTPTGRIEYQLPVGPKAKAYHPDAFKGDNHSITMTAVSKDTMKSRRNLALNALDKRWETGYYPHTDANVVTRDEPWFEAKNAIDGCFEREGHGQYPYQSWGGGLRDDLEFTLDFGREVLVDEIVIYLRADYTDDHDINWETGTIELSDGHSIAAKMKKTQEGQSFKFEPQKITWVKLKNLKREISAAFTALTQIEVYGEDI